MYRFRLISLLLCVSISSVTISGCSLKNIDGKESEILVIETQTEKENRLVNEAHSDNRIAIAEALGVEKDSGDINPLLSILDTINAGQVHNIEVAAVDGEKVINLTAEDGTDYRVYLSGNGSVEAVKNLITGKWLIRSTR